MFRGMLGLDTGVVLRCARSGDCSAVPGSTAPFPNGIQVDAAGSTLYLNAYLPGEVRKISLGDGRLLGTAHIKGPDNSQWTADGKLLVASQTASLTEMNACFGVRNGACAAAFEIIELDPATMSTRRLLAHKGAPMGAATVAQRVGDALAHGRDMRRKPGRLRDHGGIDVADLPAALAHPLGRLAQQLDRVGTLETLVGVGKVAANVAQARAAEQRIGDRMEQGIGIRMAQQPFVRRDVHAAKDERAALDQGMDVPTLADAKRQTGRSAWLHGRSSWVNWPRACSTACASAKSLG
jgi:hypothetical protein